MIEADAVAEPEESSEVERAAHASLSWAGFLVLLLTLSGGLGGLRLGGGVGDTAGTVLTLVGGLIGAALGFAIGMFFYSRRRLEAKVALRMDRYFNSRQSD